MLARNSECMIVAFLLNANDVIAADAVMDQDSLPQVIMPNRDGFTSPDPRPDVFSWRIETT